MKIAITLDTDSKNQNNSNWEIQKLDFNYMKELKIFYETAKRHNLPVTTFVRIDEQIAHNMGDPFAVYNAVKKIADESGCQHEFGWHPHVFSLERSTGKWSQVTTEEEIVEQLKRTYEKYEKVIKPMAGVRVGAAQSGPAILTLLTELGFRYDSSCLSGCRQMDDKRHFDWTNSPNRAFMPSKANYRIPGEDAIGIKEIPITTMMTIAQYDRSLKLRAINPAYQMATFKGGIDNFWSSTLNQNLLVVAFHGDELNYYHEDGLYRYGLANFWHNLTYLERSLVDRSISHSYCLMSEL